MRETYYQISGTPPDVRFHTPDPVLPLVDVCGECGEPANAERGQLRPRGGDGIKPDELLHYWCFRGEGSAREAVRRWWRADVL